MSKWGISETDIIKALITFKISNYLIWSGCMIIAHRYKPLNRIRLPQMICNVREKVIMKVSSVMEWRIIKPIPTKLNIPPQQFANTLVDGTVIYKCTLPITIPLQLYGIVKIFTPQFRE